MVDEHTEYPEFQLRLPNRGPVARGRQTNAMGTNGSRKFVVGPGQPVRPEAVPSFAMRVASAHRLREELIRQGRIVPSTTWPTWLETADTITFNSSSEAAAVLTGRSANGWVDWKTEDNRPLGDFMPGMWMGPNRPWLIRGSNVTGLDLVQRLWLPEGRVSLAASRLRQGVRQGTSKDDLRTFIQEDYESTATYGQKQQLVEELHAFLSRMKPGDTVCTISGGQLYVGEVTGEAEQIESEDRRSNLRRPVEWQPTGYPYDDLPEELQQKLSIQHDVVDLSAVQALVEGLGLSDEELAEEAEAIERDPSGEIPALVARRELELPDPTDALTDELLVHETEWLREVRDLLADERQLVLYGPPGTGKTYLALKLAEFLGGGPEQVKLIQFHPAYLPAKHDEPPHTSWPID
jgi:5-methylcytosine-specific restriction protein B